MTVLYAQAVLTNRQTQLNADIGPNAKLRIFTGVKPSSAGGVITNQVLVSEHLCGSPFGTVANGVLTANQIAYAIAASSGQPTFYGLYKADGVTLIQYGDIPLDLSLTPSTVTAGDPIVITSAVMTAAATASGTPTTPAPTKIAGTAPTGQVGVPYTFSFTGSGGTSPLTFSVLSGTLPAGLSLSSSGTLTGTPTAVATSTFVVRVTDSASTPQHADSASQSVSIVAATGDTKPRMTTGTASASLATLFAAATDVPSSTNGTRSGTFTVNPSSGQYGYVFILQSACVALGGGAYGATFTDSLGAGGWSGAGLPGNNTGASPSQSTSSTTYTDTTGVYVVFRQDYAAAGSDTFTIS